MKVSDDDFTILQERALILLFGNGTGTLKLTEILVPAGLLRNHISGVDQCVLSILIKALHVCDPTI